MMGENGQTPTLVNILIKLVFTSSAFATWMFNSSFFLLTSSHSGNCRIQWISIFEISNDKRYSKNKHQYFFTLSQKYFRYIFSALR